MTKRRTTKRSKATPRKPVRKAKARPVLQRVVLSPDDVLRVAIPPGTVPLVVSDPDKGELVIAPERKKTFWERLFS